MHCPKCKEIFLQRSKGGCRFCGQVIVRSPGFVSPGDYWWNKKEDRYYSYGEIAEMYKAKKLKN
mgnify:FL=1